MNTTYLYCWLVTAEQNTRIIKMKRTFTHMENEANKKQMKEEHFSIISNVVACSNDSQYGAWFDEIARHVLNRFVLCLLCGKVLCKLTEIEIYFSEKDSSNTNNNGNAVDHQESISSSYRHYDPYCHQHRLECTPKLWYFLRAGPLDHHDYKVSSYYLSDFING
jgi:hypothetical protein